MVADTLPVQIDILKEGLASGNVGQRPFEMGYKAMYCLKDIKDGKPAPKDPTYTGLDVCTPEDRRDLHRRRVVRATTRSHEHRPGAASAPGFLHEQPLRFDARAAGDRRPQET